MSSKEGKNLRLALEMQWMGLAMMKENLKRRYPDLSARDLEVKYLEWLSSYKPTGENIRIVYEDTNFGRVVDENLASAAKKS